MSVFDNIERFLPQYLSAESRKELFSELKKFPDNHKIYTIYLDDDPDILQGDGLRDQLVVHLPEGEIVEGPVMVLTNTCDISQDNERAMPTRIAYCPIIKLSSYVGVLRSVGKSDSEIKDQTDAIRRQEFTTLFYLPANASLKEECIALLDRPVNCDMAYLEAPERRQKLFILSQYGWYLFLVKLSIHFTRLNENIDRR